MLLTVIQMTGLKSTPSTRKHVPASQIVSVKEPVQLTNQDSTHSPSVNASAKNNINQYSIMTLTETARKSTGGGGVVLNTKEILIISDIELIDLF